MTDDYEDYEPTTEDIESWLASAARDVFTTLESEIESLDPNVRLDDFDEYGKITMLLRKTKELKSRLEEAIEARRPHVENRMLESGMSKWTHENGLTFHYQQKLVVNRAGGVSMEEIVEVLHKIGRGDIVSPQYKASSLKEYVKEQLALEAESPDGEKYLPEELRQLLYIDDRAVLRPRKS